MKRPVLSDRLSSFSWKSIEILMLFAVFFLPFSKTLTEGFVFSALLAWLARKLIFGERIELPKFTLIAYLVFAGVVIASLTQVPSPYFETACKGVQKWVKYLSVFAMCAELYRDAARVRRLCWTFAASMFAVILNGAYQIQFGKDLIKGYTVADVPGRFVRMQSSFQAPNGLAAALLLNLSVILYSIVREARKFPRAAWIAYFFLSLWAFLMTMSRGALFGLIAAAIVYVFVLDKKRIGFVFLMLVAVTVFAWVPLRETFIGSLSKSDITIAERLDSWQSAGNMVRRHPLLGIGPNLYLKRLPEFRPAGETYYGYAHNSYLQIAGETGLLGIVAFLFPLGFFFWVFLRRSGKSPEDHAVGVLALGVMAFLIHALFDTHFQSLQTAYLFWIFWGVLQADYFVRAARARS